MQCILVRGDNRGSKRPGLGVLESVAAISHCFPGHDELVVEVREAEVPSLLPIKRSTSSLGCTVMLSI